MLHGDQVCVYIAVSMRVDTSGNQDRSNSHRYMPIPAMVLSNLFKHTWHLSQRHSDTWIMYVQQLVYLRDDAQPAV